MPIAISNHSTSLATATAGIIDHFRPWSYADHPALEAPYLEEFRPLVGPNGGIKGFPAHLTFGRYCADRDTSLPELEAYLTDLARLAARLGRRPVYGFVRTDMRVGWFRDRMPGPHIFIRREPRRQFLSMLNQAKQGNPYFLLCGLVVLLHNKDEPAFAPLLSAIDLPALLDSSELHVLSQGRLTKETPLAQLYVIFYFMRLLAKRRGEAQCDLVIDIDRLSLDDGYRHEIEVSVGDLTGMAISFADCRITRYAANLGWSDPFFDALKRDIEGCELAVTRQPGHCFQDKMADSGAMRGGDLFAACSQ